METQGSPSHIRQSTTSLLTKPDKTITPYFNIHFNSVLPSTFTSSK